MKFEHHVDFKVPDDRAYKVDGFDDWVNVAGALKHRGSEGWELVQVVRSDHMDVDLYWKRPVEE